MGALAGAASCLCALVSECTSLKSFFGQWPRLERNPLQFGVGIAAHTTNAFVAGVIAYSKMLLSVFSRPAMLGICRAYAWLYKFGCLLKSVLTSCVITVRYDSQPDSPIA